jgi:phage N-6-adenine-methyltransferase
MTLKEFEKIRRFSNSTGERMKNDEFRTPPAIFAALDDEFHFTVDVAANEENALCKGFIRNNAAGGALEEGRKWGLPGGTWWCNPPYSQPNIEKFLEMADFQATVYGTSGVVLVPLDPTAGWRRFVLSHAAEVRIVMGRLRFLNADGTQSSSCARCASALIVYRPRYHGPTATSYVERAAIEARGNSILGLRA